MASAILATKMRLWSRPFSSHTALTTSKTTLPPLIVPRILAFMLTGQTRTQIHADIVRLLPLPDVLACARASQTGNAVVEDQNF